MNIRSLIKISQHPPLLLRKTSLLLIFFMCTQLSGASSFKASNQNNGQFGGVNTLMNRKSYRSNANYQIGYQAGIRAISSSSVSSPVGSLYSTSGKSLRSYGSAGAYTNTAANYGSHRSNNTYSSATYSYSAPSYVGSSLYTHSSTLASATSASSSSAQSGSASVAALATASARTAGITGLTADYAGQAMPTASVLAAQRSAFNGTFPAIRREATVTQTTDDNPDSHVNGASDGNGGYYYWNADKEVWEIWSEKKDQPEPFPIGDTPWLLFAFLLAIFLARRKRII